MLSELAAKRPGMRAGDQGVECILRLMTAEFAAAIVSQVSVFSVGVSR
jgi:hypothetical protein